MPCGKLDAKILAARLSDDIAKGAQQLRCELTVAGSDHESPKAVSQVVSSRDSAWEESLSVMVPAGAHALVLELYSCSAGPSDALLGAAEVSMDDVFKDDVHSAQIPMASPSGDPVGTVDVVFRFFHGRNERAGHNKWVTMNRTSSHVSDYEAQFRPRSATAQAVHT